MLEQLNEYHPTLKWEANYKEHYYEYYNGFEKHVVFYPSMRFLSERIKLANELGCGLGIWEIGQGLNFFYDLL